MTAIRTTDGELTKNQYRREWRAGGVANHDMPMRVEDDRQRLIVALVQKKVSELIGSERFKSSFQIGMLASFESFLETAKVKRSDDTTFDDAGQTDDVAERDGLDVRDVNQLARRYRDAFGHEMPHPKMDALVGSLSDAWRTGKKSLVFVRRVASVRELKKRLDERYDEWLIGLLRERLPESALSALECVVIRYNEEKHSARDDATSQTPDGDDSGGRDTFFAWYFRGDGPKNAPSAAQMLKSFQKGAFSTFFASNQVASLLDVSPADCGAALAGALKLELDEARQELRRRAAKYLSATDERMRRSSRYEAAQAAAVEMLQAASGQLGTKATIVWNERYQSSQKSYPAKVAPDVFETLNQTTFFSELQRPHRRELREAIWPSSSKADFRARFREEEIRASMLEAAARLGHAFIDIYCLLSATPSAAAETDETPGVAHISDYLDLLDKQRSVPSDARQWSSFDELYEIAMHFEIIVDTNLHDIATRPLSAIDSDISLLLRAQQPVVGMSGKVNRTAVQQFRMPGYPFVLITTDILQEGEDLHTFCSSIQHYGISWTPSAMEQRIGRIDRVRSQTDRRFSRLKAAPAAEDFLQVFYPYLADTVEVLQVQNVLGRMNEFLRLMHEGLAPPPTYDRSINVGRELTKGKRSVEQIRGRLRSSFPIPDWALRGDTSALAVSPTRSDEALARLSTLAQLRIEGMGLAWQPATRRDTLFGTATLRSGRVQPFALYLESEGDHLLLHCISPVGRVGLESLMADVERSAASLTVRIGAIVTKEARSYDLTVEEDVLLADAAFDHHRAALLIDRVVQKADELERRLLPTLDQELRVFEGDLQREANNGE